MADPDGAWGSFAWGADPWGTFHQAATVAPVYFGSAAIPAFGTSIQVIEFIGTSFFWHTIANVDNIKLTGIKSGSVDVSCVSGPDHWTRKVVTLINPGSITFDIFYNPAEPTHNAVSAYGLLASIAGRVTRGYRILLGASQWQMMQFRAFVTSFPVDSASAGVIKSTVSLELTGEPAFY